MLYCLWKIGFYGEEDDEDLVLLVFQAYLNVTRLLQREYMLEPAGSHGVWGLDDYSFLPFLWGSSQLEDSKRIPPSVISDDAMLAEHREEYLYWDAIVLIKGKDARVEQAADDEDGERAAHDGASQLSETSRSRPHACPTATHAGAKPASSVVASCRNRRATSVLPHAK
ncbi:unnamed protein product [Chondrus crispus]|uniref:Serine/threonine-protein phosphatase 2A activator n=1 Tax=Chondrus crispus TaxID=2769 RepID=R7QPP1_CHOCR|nr:unnamed protein product [Chondrus crispus]CDF40054.1 unnamed protein product [Chondrus crispus]|eukprot:XP_005710348.1 unnamed protein product [Chondrus crispus]